MARPISLAALTVLELPPAERVYGAAAAGYEHVSLRLVPATPNEAPWNLVHDAALRREVERALADTGLAVLDAEILRLMPDTRIADFEPFVACAAALGARELLVAGQDADAARLADRFAALCDVAARHGLGVNLECMPWTEVATLADARRTADAAARPNGGVLVDAFHWSRSHGTVADVAAIPRTQLRYAQLCDVPAAVPPTLDAIRDEARAERRFPGDGGLDLPGLLRALPPDLPLALEIPTHTLARTVGAVERARRALAATHALLAQVAA